MKNMKKNPKQNRESSLMRSPLILGLSMVLCIPVAYSHAKSSNIVKNESVQSILQGRTIKGQIIDENNEPLIGVSVIIKGASTIGTITDFDGNYALEVPAGKNVLEISESFSALWEAVVPVNPLLPIMPRNSPGITWKVIPFSAFV